MVTPITGLSDSEQLSALVDGEVDAAELHGACEAWRGDVRTRATWHSYHLIGDVLRSDDLASDAAYDCSFLLALRVRLATESASLEPALLNGGESNRASDVAWADESLRQVAVAPTVLRGHRSAWLVPSAIAAGFALVVGAFTVSRSDLSGPAATGSTALAVLEHAPTPRGSAATPFDRATTVASANGPVLRDARLDRYLEAHKQFAGSSVLGTPSAFLRGATVVSSAR